MNRTFVALVRHSQAEKPRERELRLVSILALWYKVFGEVVMFD
jgi:hypothetical protein